MKADKIVKKQIVNLPVYETGNLSNMSRANLGSIPTIY